MATNQPVTDLVPVVTPANTDIFAVRQIGDTRDKRITASQMLSLVTASSLPAFQFTAADFQNPNNADWAVNALAPAIADSLNNGLTIRAFDDTTEEGIGFQLILPTATNIILEYVFRAQTAPPAPRTIGINLYQRGVNDDAALDAWSAGTQLADLAVNANTNFNYFTDTITFATLGIASGELTQFELTRINPTAGTELVGDWNLLELRVSFS